MKGPRLQRTRSAVHRLRSRLPRRLRSPDAAAVTLLFVLTVVATRGLLFGGTTIGLDAATQFYPWYSFLGESLHSGQLPGWNPSQLSGAPFAGDPLSGWTYLPAMLLFTLLPLAAAAKSFMFAHLLLAGVSMYALARALRLGVPGALLAAVAFEYSGFMYFRNICCFAYSSVTAWLPLTLLGAELAIRSRSTLTRLLWCGLAGLALSQILASWLGQGSYYALVALGGYVLYRSLLFPPENIRGLRGRLLALTLTGGAVLIFGFGLAAAGLLSRLEYNALASISEVYESQEGVQGGWMAEELGRLFQQPGLFYAGATVLALALSAPFICRTAYAVPYTAALALTALTLSGEGTTPLHSLLYLLPQFETIHTHSPQRAMILFYPAAALLAGAAVTGLAGRARPALTLLPALAGMFLVTRSGLMPPADRPEISGFWSSPTAFLKENGVSIPPGPLITLLLVAGLAAAYSLLPARRAALRGVAALSLVLVVFVELFAVGSATIENHSALSGQGELAKVDLAEYYAPSGAGRFLLSREGPFRYFGYDGVREPHHRQFTDPETNALEVNARATLREGLQSVQGYNAVHLQRYDDFLEALNGDSQSYHNAFVLEGGIGSPLLDLLNVRYVTVPAEPVSKASEGLEGIEGEYSTVYEGERVNVLENPDALPRAWIVHSARQTGLQEALDLLSSGEVDPRRTALLETDPPPLRSPEDPSRDEARVTEYGANRIELSTATGAQGLLVLGEVYYPGWKAYVDGEQVPIRRADHLLRAIPLPAGEHTVELRYEPWTLRAGLAISTLTAAAMLAAVVAALLRRRKGARSRRSSDMEQG